MIITVEYTSQLKQAAGLSAEQFEFDIPCTPIELTRRIVDKHGDPLRRILLDEEGHPNPTVLIFVEGDLIRPDSPRQLRDREVVTYMTPISGG